MSNPHCRPPVPFGKEQPDGSVVLDKAEAVWLRTVFSRIDTAQSEVKEAFYENLDVAADLRSHTTEQAQHYAAHHVIPLVDVAVEPRTDADKRSGITRLRGKLTIIRGGLPPRPAF